MLGAWKPRKKRAGNLSDREEATQPHLCVQAYKKAIESNPEQALAWQVRWTI